MQFRLLTSVSGMLLCGVLAAAQQLEPIPPSQSVIPAFVTADSGVKSSGVGTTWSHWYRLEVGRLPAGIPFKAQSSGLPALESVVFSRSAGNWQELMTESFGNFDFREKIGRGCPPRLCQKGIYASHTDFVNAVLKVLAAEC